MGQIFDRLSGILKSGITTDTPNLAEFMLKNEDDELRSIIDDLNNKKKEQNYSKKDFEDKYSKVNVGIDQAYQILKIDSATSNDDIKIAYKNRIKEYHPDKVSTMGEEIQSVARIKTQQINEAYSLLKKIKNF